MNRLLFTLLLAGCDPVVLIVVDVPDSGAFQPRLGPACADTSECLAGQLCEKPACGASLGRCVRRPGFCDGNARPQCGCDGITYWNDCLRRAAGVEAIENHGECLNPLLCDTATACPGDALCGRIVFPNECSRLAAGACYVLPNTCEGLSSDHFIQCGTSACIDPCTAIRSGQATMRIRGPCM